MLLILSYQQPHLIKPQENHRKGGSFLSIVKHSACKLVHEVNVFQDFYFIHVIHIFYAS